VVNAEVLESTFPDDATLRTCLVAAWRAIRVSPLPHGHTIVRSKLAWESPAHCSDPSGQRRGSLEKTMIRRVIQSHLDEVRTCYERRLTATYSPEGRVIVQFTIANDGTVVAAVVESSTVDDAAMTKCIVQLPRTWRYPRPCGGGIVIVSYPFVFKVGR
jgi:hypothetical protein